MSSIRTVIFWLHLVVGVVAGAVILVMSATGTLLMFERQITEWADRASWEKSPSPPAPAAARMPLEALVAGVRAARPGIPPTSVTMQADPTAPVAVSLGRERTLYVNPYTGQLLGEGSPKVRAFFRGVTSWHRWLGAGEERRDLARKITGACNLGFLILVVSGLYLWLPRKWTRRQVRNVAWFRRGLNGKARDFNWHNVIGLWMWVPLFLVVLTGVVMSYPWANNLLFRLAGDKPPERSPEGPRERQGRGERGGGEVSLDGLDPLWARAERQVPGWRSISLPVARLGRGAGELHDPPRRSRAPRSSRSAHARPPERRGGSLGAFRQPGPRPPAADLGAMGAHRRGGRDPRPDPRRPRVGGRGGAGVDRYRDGLAAVSAPPETGLARGESDHL